MDLASVALFLVPGPVAVIMQRFAAVQIGMSAATQVLLAVVYSAAVYGLLATVVGSVLVTDRFPAELFRGNPETLADPQVAGRLAAISLVAAVAGWGVGRLLTSRPVGWILRRIGGRSIYSRVWDEVFHRAPKQWVRLKSDTLELMGWLELVSDEAGEARMVLSSPFVLEGGVRRAIPATFLLVDASQFPVVVLLGRDVAATYAAAARRA